MALGNFILDDDFEGFRASYMHSRYQHTNDNDESSELVRSYDYEVADGDSSPRARPQACTRGGGVLDGLRSLKSIEKTDTVAHPARRLRHLRLTR